MWQNAVDKIWNYLGWYGVALAGLGISASISGLVATFASTSGTRFLAGLAGYALTFLIGFGVGKKVG